MTDPGWAQLLEKLRDDRRKDVRATPNLDCEACWQKRLHTREEFTRYHPEAGHGGKVGTI
jgi:hypothetical protein